jgi:hypothetical protein
VKSTEAGAHEILDEMSDKEYLARRAIAGMMPCLNRVFKELRIHHEEHDVPAKVHKSLEDKAKKAATKNVTAAAEVKKRNGSGASKVVSKRQKTIAASTAASADASAAASTDDGEEVAKNVGGGTGSMAAGMGGERSAASLDLGGNDFIDTALQGMGGGPTAEPSIVAPIPGVLDDDSSSSEGEDTGSGDASPPREKEAASVDHRHPMATLVEVSEDEAEACSPAASFQSVAF